MTAAVELKSLHARIRELEAENAVLRSDVNLLRSKLGPATWRLDGHKAERYSRDLIGGELQRGSAPYDLKLPSGVTFEVKFSNLNEAVPGKITRRWNWAHILGSSGSKKFDLLLPDRS